MFRNVFLKTLRDHRWGALIWGALLGIDILADIGTYREVSKSAAQLEGLSKAYESFSFLLGSGFNVSTLGGFLMVESLIEIPLLLGLWAAVVGVGVTRGEEEPGTLDVLLSSPLSRHSILLQKVAAALTLIVVAILVISLLMLVGLSSTNQTLPADAAALALLNCGLVVAFWAAAGVFAGQFFRSRRTASLTVGSILLATYLINNLAQSAQGIEFLAWLTPFYYYSLSAPLDPDRGLDVPGFLMLVGLTAGLVALSTYNFSRRDIGGALSLAPASSVVRRPSSVVRRPSFLGSVFQKSLRDQATPALYWGLGLGFYGAVIAGTAREALAPIRESISQIEMFEQLFGDLVSNEAYLSITMFYFLPIILAIYAVIQVWTWASEEEEGRLEMEVAAPVPRWPILTARYLAAIAGLAIILALTAAGTLVTAALTGFDLDTGRVLGALLATAPLMLATLAFGLALATWAPRPSIAVGVTGGIVVLMFFLETLATLFDLPDFVHYLSVFYLYGRPLIEGIPWGNYIGLAAAALLLAAASLVGFERRDIAK